MVRILGLCRNYLRTEEVAGVARRYCHTVLGFLAPTQVSTQNYGLTSLMER